MDSTGGDKSEQSNKSKNPSTVEPADDDYSDTDNSSEMPPLETIEQEMNANPNNKKNIVIPEDKNDKKDKDDSDDEQSNDGYMDILNNGDLKKKTIKNGETNVRPQRGSKVIIRLETRLYNPGHDDKDVGNGTIIKDETFDRFTLTLGDNDLHQGLDLLIPLMELHEVCRAIIKPRFGYGPMGNKNIGIPEEATLDCTIELLEIPTPSDNVYGEEDENADSICNKESLDERLKFGNYKKTRGNFWFERAEYSLAIQCYRGALKYLDANNDELKVIDQNKQQGDDKTKCDEQLLLKIEDLIDKRAQTFNNLAAAQLKMQAFDSALRSVKDSLLLRPNNVKALFRQAKILSEKGEYEEAIEDLKKAAQLDPKSEAIALELDRLTKIVAKQLKDQKELYRRMMQVKDDPKQNGQSKNNKTNINNKQNCFNQAKSVWSWLRWPATLSLGVVAVAGGAILLQTLLTTAK